MPLVLCLIYLLREHAYLNQILPLGKLQLEIIGTTETLTGDFNGIFGRNDTY